MSSFFILGVNENRWVLMSVNIDKAGQKNARNGKYIGKIKTSIEGRYKHMFISLALISTLLLKIIYIINVNFRHQEHEKDKMKIRKNG
jgi:hypothetical protein